MGPQGANNLQTAAQQFAPSLAAQGTQHLAGGAGRNS